MSNELMIPEIKEPQKVFVDGGMKPFVKAIDDIIKDFKPDVSTEKGRKEIASLAHSIARSKTYLDGVGKDTGAGYKAKAKVIDNERKYMRDELDKRKAQVRAPLDDFEEAQKARIAALEDRVSEFEQLSFAEYTPDGITSDELKANLDKVKAIKPDESFEEYQPRATEVKLKAIERLELLIVNAEKKEAEQAELQKLREEKAAKEAKEREEAIRKEERERMERQQKEADKAAAEKAKAEKEAHEQALKDAAEKAKQAEAQAKKDAEAAAQAERDRIQAEKQAEEYAKRKREEDQKHRAKINNEALKAFIDGGLSEKDAKQAVTLIASKSIPNVFISY